MSFPRKWESIIDVHWYTVWIPVSTGMTTFINDIFVYL